MEKIGKNNVSCLSDLHLDLDNLDSVIIPKTPRKRKAEKQLTQKKKKPKMLSFLDDEADEADDGKLYF